MKSRVTATLRTWSPSMIAAAFTAVFITPWCGVLFGCGCTWLWAGSASFCNIHHAMGPHCPWCSHGTAGFDVIAAGGILLAQGLVMEWLQRQGRRWPIITLAGIAMFFLAGTLMACAFALYDHAPLLFPR